MSLHVPSCECQATSKSTSYKLRAAVLPWYLVHWSMLVLPLDVLLAMVLMCSIAVALYTVADFIVATNKAAPAPPADVSESAPT